MNTVGVPKPHAYVQRPQRPVADPSQDSPAADSKFTLNVGYSEHGG
jgi:hypothetical protein